MKTIFTIEIVREIQRRIMKEKFSDLNAGDMWEPEYSEQEFVDELNKKVSEVITDVP